MVILAFILASLSATQDAVIDAHRTEYLFECEFALGASLAMSGYRLAMLLSGGLALVIASTWGFAVTYRVMGAAMGIGILATLWSPEPSQPSFSNPSFGMVFVEPFKNLSQKPGILILCAFILTYKLAESFTTTTSGIVMPFLIQEMKFSLATIGYVNKILGITAIVLGGLVAGFLLLRWSIWRALLMFGLLQALTNALFIKLALGDKSILWFSIAVASDNFAAGMGSTALIALLMRCVDQHFTATQFSMLVALAMLPRVLSGPLGAFLQAHFGWIGLYQIGFILAFLFIPFLWKLRRIYGGWEEATVHQP
jgi:PAT family beta-lactamase induction signal transducer AmpG